MSTFAQKTASGISASPGTARTADQPPGPASSAPIAPAAPAATDEKPTLVEPPQRPPSDAPRPQTTPSPSQPTGLTAELTTIGLLDRFTPESRDLQPPPIHPGFHGQLLHDLVYDYYFYRFTDIAYASDSTIAYVAQIASCAQRVTTVTLCSIVNKLILGNRADGLPVNNLANPIGPPKGFLHPSVAASVIAAIGKTSPIWSGDQFFLPSLENAVPAINDHTGNAIPNIHRFPANPGLDMVVLRFCSAGSIPTRSVDWKIPGGTHHWLTVLERNNGRTNALIAPDIHPDNYDPANTLLSCVCACTRLQPNACRYVIMRGIADTTIWSLISTAYE